MTCKYVVKGECKSLAATLAYEVIHNLLSKSPHGVEITSLTTEAEEEETEGEK